MHDGLMEPNRMYHFFDLLVSETTVSLLFHDLIVDCGSNYLGVL